MSENTPPAVTFDDLNLPQPLLKSLAESGYQTPSPIQAQTIPPLLEGRDLIGQAQTGTGKTAAFALPFLSAMDPLVEHVQFLVLTPTRELAIQVCEAFNRYGAHIKKLRTVPIYGGQDYGIQLRALKKGVQIVVGTPGRVMDHMRRGTLDLSNLSGLVLDEADEMLRMGFIEDVKWILSETPAKKQIALFSATMPKEIQTIASKHLNKPKRIIIKATSTAADTITQKYWMVGGTSKVDALCRILEFEATDGVIVFVKTRAGTVELSDALKEAGYSSSPLNGDMAQKQRENTVDRFKTNRLNILVATDVAARGLDVSRISHVINFDAPFDVETYVHRIGRTGRAGKTGVSILFITHREKRLLHAIGRSTKQTVAPLKLPSINDINAKRIESFFSQVTTVLKTEDLSFYQDLIARYLISHSVSEIDLCATMAHLLHKDSPLLLKKEKRRSSSNTEMKPQPKHKPSNKETRARKPKSAPVESGMIRYRLAVGRIDGVKPGNIVGAIANESGLDSEHIGHINIYDDYSTVDLPEGMPKRIHKLLQKVWVCDKQLKLAKLNQAANAKMSQDLTSQIPPSQSTKPRKSSRTTGNKTKPKDGSPSKGKKTKQKK